MQAQYSLYSQDTTTASTVDRHTSHHEADSNDHDDGDHRRSSPTSSPKSASLSSSRKFSRSFKQFVSDVRVKIKLRGLEEINDDHYLQGISSAMRIGLQAAYKHLPLKHDKESLTSDDYSEIEEHVISIDDTNKEAMFKTYAPKVFQSLRRFERLSADEYHGSLEDRPYLQYKSNSRSGQIFFMSNDKRYFLKTEKQVDAKMLLRMLPDYVTHLTYYPHSLLVRIHGLYFIKLPGSKGKFFTVMQSVFHPEEGNDRYDIKGCVANRYVKPEKEGSKYVTVLKDVNFGDQKLHLNDQRQWFLRQIDLDVGFLKRFNIMDYSLLIEQRSLHFTDLEHDQELSDLVIRVTKSVPRRRTGHNADTKQDNHAQPSSLIGSNTEVQGQEDTVDIPGTVSNHEGRSVDIEIVHQPHIEYNSNMKGGESAEELGDFELGRVHRDSYKTTQTAGEGALSVTNVKEHNQRLLPNVQNAIHVVDGERDRYYVGVIDILGQYTWKKKMETVFKSCINPRTTFSSVNSEKYAKRFKDYIIAHSD